MSGSEGVVRIKGDNSDLDSKTQKSVENFRKLGEHASKAHGHGKSFGEAMSHANQHMERSLIRGLSLAHVMREAAAAAKAFQDESAKASKSVGGNALERDLAAQKLGMTTSQAEAAVSGRGAATAEERNKYFASLADTKIGRGKQQITQQQVFQLQSAFNSGLFSEEELKKAAESGDLSKLGAGARLAGLSTTGRREYETRATEYESKERAEELRSGRGFGVRQADAAIDLRNAEHPVVGALQDFVGAATSVVGGKDAITIGDRLLQKTDEQTDIMRQDANKPTLAPGAE